jgi:hypothetical protein
VNCDDVRERMPGILAGEPGGSEVEAHLAGCAECRQDVEMCTRMAAWEDEEPSPRLQQRFESALAGYHGSLAHSWWEGFWPARPAFQFAVALVALGAGLFAGYGLGTRSLIDEVRQTRRLVAVSLLQQDSASERLRGVTWSYRMKEPGGEVLAALVHALKYDSSVDVRLAAADALRRYTAQPVVREGVLDGLKVPQSPLVQVELIDVLVESRMPQAAAVLRDLSNDPNLNEAVRSRARGGLTALERQESH